jgi:hypothetical protein
MHFERLAAKTDDYRRVNSLLPAQLRVVLAHELCERAVDGEITSISMVVKERQVMPSVSTKLAAENTRSQKLSSAASAPIWPGT